MSDVRHVGFGVSREALDVEDYLHAASDASKRTRTITVVGVVASVLVLMALLNSLRSHWMLKRLQLHADDDVNYIESKIGMPPKGCGTRFEPSSSTSDNVDLPASRSIGSRAAIAHAIPACVLYWQMYASFQASMTRAYVETAYVVKVPFFWRCI